MNTTSLRIRRLLCHVGAGLLVTAAVAVVPAALSAPASAGDERPACSKEDPGGSSDKKCPTPTPTTAGTEVGCRDITYGQGQYRAPLAAAGSALEFQLELAEPSCSEVSYTIIARDMDTLAELGRLVQSGNDVSSDLFAAFTFPSYSKQCIAVDIVVSEGDVVHDVAPNFRDASLPNCDLNRDGTGPQTWN